jgi:hypothetical protein
MAQSVTVSDPKATLILVDTSAGPKRVFLPLTTDRPGRVLTIKDSVGLANINNIILQPSAGELIESAAATVIDSLGWVTIVADPSIYTWRIMNKCPTTVFDIFTVNTMLASNAGISSIQASSITTTRLVSETATANYGQFSSISAGTLYVTVVSTAVNVEIGDIKANRAFLSSIGTNGLSTCCITASNLEIQQIQASNLNTSSLTVTNLDAAANLFQTSTLTGLREPGFRYFAQTAGGVSTSKTLATWTTASLGLNSLKNMMTISNTIYALGSNSSGYTAIKKSTDAVTFTDVTTPPNTGLKQVNGLAYGESPTVFVVVGADSGGTLAYSTDNQSNYTIILSGQQFTGGSGNAISYGNGVFVAVGLSLITSNTLLTSVSGTSFSSNTIGFYPGATSGGWGVAFGRNRFVAVGDTDGTTTYPGVLSSPDGVNWSLATNLPAYYAGRAVVYGKNTFVTAGYNFGGSGQIAYSLDDGVTWATATTPVTPATPFSNLIFSDNTFYTVFSNAGSNVLLSSGDGINWSNATNSYFAGINATITAFTGGTILPSNFNQVYMPALEISSLKLNTGSVSTLQASSIAGGNANVSSITWSSMNAFDSGAKGTLPLTLSSAFFKLNGMDISTVSVKTEDLRSTVIGLGSSSYISTSQLTSTVTGVNLQFGTPLASTVTGLGTAGYISSAQFTQSLFDLGLNFSTLYSTFSTFYLSSLYMYDSATPVKTHQPLTLSSSYLKINGLDISTVAVGDVSKANLTSTVAGLGSASYISTTQLTSTVAGLGTTGYLSTVFSTFSTVFTSSLYMYDSADSRKAHQVLTLSSSYFKINGLDISTVGGGGGGGGGISVTDLTSTVTGLGSASYISTSQLTSTVQGLGNSQMSNISVITTFTGGLYLGILFA